MLRRRFFVIALALGLSGATACHRQSADERVVGIWQFSSMDATMDYVFKSDNTFEVWAESMDVEQSKGPWLQMDFGTWKVDGDELVMEYKRPRSPGFEEFLKSQRIDLPPVNRRKVLRFGADRIEFSQGGPFSRANARRGI